MEQNVKFTISNIQQSIWKLQEASSFLNGIGGMEQTNDEIVQIIVNLESELMKSCTGIKMTTVAQMIEWMKTLPAEAEVMCGVEVTGGYDTYMVMRPVDIESCSILDYTSEEDQEKYPRFAGKVFVQICGE